ncbi:MAG: hypothetical protein K8R21_00260 [Leptospira sp.]|nr:hypothetical protein [Leptospira sp.]
MKYKVEDANQKLKEGEFEKAKALFSELLDKEPDNPEFISGFFISSYWDNRLENILISREGKERGKKLFELFEEFEKEISRREYPKTESLVNITFCILQEASIHFRLAYQTEGLVGLDSQTLIQLSFCLMKTGDYKNAYEILSYSSRNYDKSSISVLLCQAECLYHLGEHRKSKIAYREGMLLDPALLKIDLVESEPLRSAINEIKQNFKSEIYLLEYLPVYCIEKNLLPDLRDYSEEELNRIVSEISRLSESIGSGSEEIQFKVKCRIIQNAVTFLDSPKSKNLRDSRDFVKRKLDEADPGFLGRRGENNRDF